MGSRTIGVYPGETTYSLAENVEVTPLAKFTGAK